MTGGEIVDRGVGEVLKKPGDLRDWLAKHLKLTFPAKGVCPGHCTPFEYLRASYFDQRDLIVWAPRGGGKTRLGAAATLLDLLHKPPCAVRILGGSLEQSLRMWEHLQPDVMEHAADLIAGKAKIDRIKLTSGSSVSVLAQSQRAVRGLRVQKMRCDEVELFDPEVWEAAQLVTRSIKGEKGPITGTIEALSTYHKPWGLMGRVIDSANRRGIRVLRWCLIDVLEKCAGRECEECDLQEDCHGVAKNECEGFFCIDDALAMKRRVSKLTWEAEMLCRRPEAKGSVFPMFDPAIHVRTEPPLCAGGGNGGCHLFLGVDFGFNNPFVCLWIRSWDDGMAFVVDEYVQDSRTIDQHVKQIKSRSWGDIHIVACDPAGNGPNDQTAKSNVDVLEHSGFDVVSRGSKIQDGLEMIRAALGPAVGSPKLFIHPRCERLIHSLQAYHYREGGGETPHKDNENDHAIDALRYFYVNRGRKTTARAGRY